MKKQEPTTESNANSNLEPEKTLIIQDLTKIYTRGKIKVNALNKLSVDFLAGEISLIIGPSGCGKTTLLKLIAGLIGPSAGTIKLKGKLINEMSNTELDTYRLHDLGYIFQFFNLISEFTVKENIAFPLEIAKKTKSEIAKRTQELLTLIDLENRKDHYPDELSGGQQQKVAIAMALANNPSIILCDEPTGELDSSSKKKIMELLQQLIIKYPEKTIIIVSHDSDMKLLADRIFYIRDGSITYIEQTDESNKGKLQDYFQGKTNIWNIHDDVESNIKETIYFLSQKLKKMQDN